MGGIRGRCGTSGLIGVRVCAEVGVGFALKLGLEHNLGLDFELGLDF